MLKFHTDLLKRTFKRARIQNERQRLLLQLNYPFISLISNVINDNLFGTDDEKKSINEKAFLRTLLENCTKLSANI